MRADRIGIGSNNFYILTETNTQTIFQEIKKLKPQLVIVDSIQTLQSPFVESGAGSISQIRETAGHAQPSKQVVGVGVGGSPVVGLLGELH